MEAGKMIINLEATKKSELIAKVIMLNTQCMILERDKLELLSKIETYDLILKDQSNAIAAANDKITLMKERLGELGIRML